MLNLSSLSCSSRAWSRCSSLGGTASSSSITWGEKMNTVIFILGLFYHVSLSLMLFCDFSCSYLLSNWNLLRGDSLFYSGHLQIKIKSTKLYLVSIFQGLSLPIKAIRPNGSVFTSSVMILPSKGAFEPCMTWEEKCKTSNQGGITCGAIDEPRKYSKAIDERVTINFHDKNVVIARFRDKNRSFIQFICICIYFYICFIYP